MNKFVDNVKSQEARTANGMKALQSTAEPCVDLFYNIGASRGKDIIPQFVAAYNCDREIALRIALWARDIRGGSGERQLFRNILQYLETHNPEDAQILMRKTPELGRFDDLLQIRANLRGEAISQYAAALKAGNGLAAKWAPRNGPIARELGEALGMNAKQYRKYIVGMTQVVETLMCAKEWGGINYSHVPSRAMQIYRKAFKKHDEARFKEWLAELTKKPEDRKQDVKVNASAVYPYQVLAMYNGYSDTKDTIDLVISQWEALPDYTNGASVLPMIDTSGSMTFSLPAAKATILQIAVSLGLYVADKNKGAFQDVFLTFSGDSQIQKVSGNIIQKVDQTCRAHWEMNTNLHSAFNKILKLAIDNQVPAEDMPQTLLILSDMQFDSCVRYDDSAMQMIQRKFEKAGYSMPNVVFWNLNAYGNAPVTFNQKGVALVSGFSPAILKSVLANDMENFTPYGVMMRTLNSERYNLAA